jgi:hypothetical protein
LFHRDAVIAAPGFTDRIVGRDACVESYRQFTDAATIHAFTDSNHSIDIWDTTAVATYHFEIDYEINGARNIDRGRDLLVLTLESPGWQIVWRTLTLDSPADQS